MNGVALNGAGVRSRMAEGWAALIAALPGFRSGRCRREGNPDRQDGGLGERDGAPPANHMRQGHSAVIESSGPCDATSGTRVLALFKVCKDRLAERPARLRLDLTGVERADSKLVACLVAVRRLAIASGTTLELRTSRAVRTWIGICHVDGVLPDADRAEVSTGSRGDGQPSGMRAAVDAAR